MDEDCVYQVVVNEEEQYSICPDFKAIPAGWKSVGKRGTKQECLDFIEKIWTDMRSLNLHQF